MLCSNASLNGIHLQIIRTLFVNQDYICKKNLEGELYQLAPLAIVYMEHIKSDGVVWILTLPCPNTTHITVRSLFSPSPPLTLDHGRPISTKSISKPWFFIFFYVMTIEGDSASSRSS